MAKVCGRTGLTIESVEDVPATQYRVFRSEHGPLNPLIRGGHSRERWNRFDPEDHATVYTSDSDVGAFVEALQDLGQKPEALQRMEDEFPGIVEEILRFNAMSKREPIGNVWAGWRLARAFARLSISRTAHAGNYYVVIDESLDGLIALTEILGADAPITATDIYTEDRLVTTRLADAIARTVLEDGSLPLGVRYHSRYGRDLMLTATWLPDFQFDGARQSGVRPAFERRFAVTDANGIDPTSTAVKKALERLNLVRMH